MTLRDLRSYLAYLDERGELATVEQQVEPRFEISAFIRRGSDAQGPAFLFNQVANSQMRVVGGLFCSTGKALHALQTDDHDSAVERFMEAIRRPTPPVEVSTGPCKEVILRGDDVDLRMLPVPTYSEQDPGPFITVAVEITRDAETGAQNAGIYRMQMFGRNEMTLAASPYSDFHAMYARAERAGRRLECAAAIGVDPVIQLASQARVPYGFDELGIAGTLHGGPVEVIRCETVDLRVPATAEIILEGYFEPHERRAEGPFGEFTGYVGPGGKEPVFHCTAMTMREDPIFQAGLTGVPVTENHVLKLLPMEANLLAALRQVSPDVVAVHYPPEGGAEFLAVVSMRQRYVNQAKNLLLSALGSVAHPKMVVVVDDDIDVYDLAKVWWAVLTRAQPSNDYIIIPEAAGGQLDPSAPTQFGSSLLGIDATRPFGEPFPEVVRIPGMEAVPDWTSMLHSYAPRDREAGR
jgi:4-hydroxy-3-polyprenylbenzoate decarboxylase/2,5-furandicarboxylate decarboxylase 1